MLEILSDVFTGNPLIVAFAIIGVTMYLSYVLSDRLTGGKIHGSAVAIILGLALAYIGGMLTGGEKGLSDISVFAGIGLMGGGMLRDFAIVATAFGASFSEIKKAGINGIVALFVGVILSFVVGVGIALAFGYTDAISLTTIGAGTATYIVGPVTGAAIGASSEVITISIAAGLVKSILIMIGTPFIAKYIGLNNPRSAMVYGGLMGSTSGVAAGLAATDPKLVPYGAVTATFFTGLGVLLAPSILFLITKTIFG
ncbi:malonate transporter subunit MadM [Planococcus sp. ISL-109]|uniref:malonate transporter subunit MadM n=1 Tax=Planococcus sp. ISL-109 TaxID=2819166 RepID=UPI001BE95FF8|nr:malonate transporter subunit MadM [Planococcus sp. ISL-109]MBT2582829.1 malonate transporter subunit MadM [Planococcus sp. ISL-109]